MQEDGDAAQSPGAGTRLPKHKVSTFMTHTGIAEFNNPKKLGTESPDLSVTEHGTAVTGGRVSTYDSSGAPSRNQFLAWWIQESSPHCPPAGVARCPHRPPALLVLPERSHSSKRRFGAVAEVQDVES